MAYTAVKSYWSLPSGFQLKLRKASGEERVTRHGRSGEKINHMNNNNNTTTTNNYRPLAE